MRAMTIFVVVLMSVVCFCCQKRTHIYGQISDEQRKGIAGMKVSVIKENSKEPSKTDTLQTALTNEDGSYVLNLMSRRRYKNIRLVNPYLINPDLQQKYRISEGYKGGTIVAECCKIIIGQPNQFGFRMGK
jgi:hypothetical protein